MNSGMRKCVSCGIDRRITSYDIVWPKNDKNWAAAYVKRICRTCTEISTGYHPTKEVQCLNRELQIMARKLKALDEKRADLLLSIDEKKAQIELANEQKDAQKLGG